MFGSNPHFSSFFNYFLTDKVSSFFQLFTVNSRILKEDFDFKTKAELKYFEYLTAEADAYEEYGGVRPIFEMGEIDYDDPVLDIYND